MERNIVKIINNDIINNVIIDNIIIAHMNVMGEGKTGSCFFPFYMDNEYRDVCNGNINMFFRYMNGDKDEK